MDGVIYRGSRLIPGAGVFIERLLEKEIPFLFITNASELLPSDLVRRLKGLGVEGLSEKHFMTCAMVAASFLKSQKPGARVFVVGENGLRNEIEQAGLVLTDDHPDYVVVGMTKTFNFEILAKAANLIRNGAHFIGTNPDAVDPVEEGILPACGSILAAIETASGEKPYIVGKPNALMMHTARKRIGAHSSETVMIGDRMDTDILAGLEAGMTTCLVLSGVSDRKTAEHFPYRPNHIFNNVGEIELEKL